MNELLKTPIHDLYKNYGGKIIDFHGWALPVQFEGLIAEHEAVRNNAGLFDVSHMGEIEVKGKDAFFYLQNLITNDLTKLHDNQVLYTFMCNSRGGIIDDLIVYKFNKEHYLLVVNAGNVLKDYEWILSHKADFTVEVNNISDELALLALQGPKAEEILQDFTSYPLKTIKAFTFAPEVNVLGVNCLLSRTGYTGEDGFEIYLPVNDAPKFWEEILAKTPELKPAGLGCRDTLRFEAGLPLYGNELTEEVTPLEAGLGFFVKLDKDNFIGKDALVKQKETGLTRKIVGFEMLEKAIPRQGYEVYSGDKKIGYVTTGYFSPTLQKNIGLALLDMAYTELNTEIEVLVRKKRYTAQVIGKRFYQNKSK
ncbi:aminomethyltransferase [Desulfonispora thiosulfatigenes DSM 11270]|uniref:Aminomethyltransferase n=1 Tax=Desulfonispora thiosulfatigenes DSM 11270 TaxID=656914 RepID=A0A1W1ULP6_DESTI|nr:glycine cleavage system aminomethyltransferase GcvT [Desulfonispora thiosulfatigenes]SMB81943.1 aminomethyltransferase [Desulfonispora thiosulfatigenes DSM 11270]